MLALSGQLEAKGISMVMMHSTGGAGGGRFGTPGSVRECALTCVGFGCSFAAWPVGPLGTSQLVVSIGSWQAILVVRALFLVSAAATFMWMGLCGGGRGHGVRWSGLAALLGIAGCVALRLGEGTPLHAALSCCYGCFLGFFAGVFGLGSICAFGRVFRRNGRVVCIAVFVCSFLFSTVLRSLALPMGSSIVISLVIMATVIAVAYFSLAALVKSGLQKEPAGFSRRRARLSLYTRAVAVSQGLTWALYYTVAVGLGFGSTDQMGPWMISLAASSVVLIGMGVLTIKTPLWEARFGSIMRWIVAAVGASWALMPLLVAYAPDAAQATCVALFLLQTVVMHLFVIELCLETSLPLLSVAARVVGWFAAAGCAGSFMYWAFRTFAEPGADYVFIAAGATIASLFVIPLLPSRGSGAGVFMMERLPEDEGLDGRIERARQSLIESAGLTLREVEVLDLLVAGLSRDDIAAMLQISPWTVKNHIHSIYGKTKTGSAKELVARIYGSEMSACKR